MTAFPPKVGIVVLNFNGRDCLLSCLEALHRLRYQNFFVVVVDNASEDDSLVSAQERFPEFFFVRSPQNGGFAAGMNIGMKVAFEQRGAAWTWLLNNDARVEEQTLTMLMAAAAQSPRAGLLSPCIYAEKTETLWFGKGRLDWLRMRAVHVSPSEEELRKQCFASEFLTGCALLVRKELVETAGFLDEHFFLYYEDADFSLRAKENGFETLVVPRARVFHGEQSQKNDDKLYFLVFSGLLFFKKHARWWQKAHFSVYGTMRRIKNVFDVARGRDGALTVRRAYNDFYHGC